MARKSKIVRQLRATEAFEPKLTSLGISLLEEKTYRVLLQMGSATSKQVANNLKTSLILANRCLASLESYSLATRSLESDPRYVAIPPDIALPSLLARRQSESILTIAEFNVLSKKSSENRIEKYKIIEILTRDEAAQLFPKLLDSAQTEVFSLERPPVLVSSIDSPGESALAALQRGVKIRTITDQNLLNATGSVSRISLAIQAGEEYRTYASLPFKLLIVDHRVGLIPLELEEPEGPILLVRSCSLLDALCDMFEMLWSRSTSVDFQTKSNLGSNRSGALTSNEALIKLLAAGISDKVLEYQLGISKRTVVRKIKLLIKDLNSSSRFQAGWNAALLFGDKKSGVT